MGFFLSVKTRVLAGGSVISLLIGAMSISPGSVVGAYAAGQTTGHAIYIGTTALAAVGSAVGSVSNSRRTRAFEVGGHSAVAKGKPALVLPSPGGTPVSRSAGGATGFAGISNLDQAVAGTGSYANSQFDLEPPDQGLCVGNGFVVESVNIALAVYSPNGRLLTAVTPLNQFYKRSPAVDPNTGAFGDFLSDPKCYYDPVSGKFVQSILEIDAPGRINGQDRTHVLLAVSATKDPTGSWNLFSIDTSNDGKNGTPAHTGCPCLPDQPLLGANRDGIFISENEFQLLPGTFPFNGAQVYALGRTELEEAGAGGTPTFAHLDLGQVSTGDANLPFWGSVQPSTSPQPQSGTEWLMSASPEDIFQNNALVDNRIAVFRVTGTETLNSDEPVLGLSHQVLTSETYGSNVFNFGATQKSGPTPLRDLLASAVGDTTEPLERLNANDSRMNQVTFADGKLFGDVNTVVTSPGKPDRVGIAYFVVDVQRAEGGGRAAQDEEGGGARIANQGYLAVKGENVLFGAIGVNSSGSGTMVFTLSGPGFFPSAAYVRFNQQGAHGSIHVLAAGTAPEDGFSGYAFFGFNSVGIARWGDYSAAVVGRDGSVWMATEFIPSSPRDVFANWGTFISHLPGGD